jgi:hypothetical protein
MSNGTKIYIQKQQCIFGFKLWWYDLCEDGYSIGEYSNVEYYKTMEMAKEAVKTFCKNDRERNMRNQPCDVAYETDCKKELSK